MKRQAPAGGEGNDLAMFAAGILCLIALLQLLLGGTRLLPPAFRTPAAIMIGMLLFFGGTPLGLHLLFVVCIEVLTYSNLGIRIQFQNSKYF